MRITGDRTIGNASARAGLAGLLFLCGCSTAGKVTGIDDQTATATQSETGACTTYAGGVSRIVVSYNDETNESQHIAYGSSTRKVVAGASLMGWSYSEDGGTKWTYGGKVAPPEGWAVLWGDPAMTASSTRYSVAFLSNLAVPVSKFPPGGIDGPFYSGGDIRSSPIGGACIAKSTDGGRTFQPYQCVSNKAAISDLPESTNGHFYDGGSMASSPSGEIFAAYVDVAASAIDVWRAANESQLFQPMPPPFPGMVAASHPRLRVGPDGALYAAAQFSTGYSTFQVFLNRYAGNAWGSPVLASDPSELYPQIDLNSNVLGSELTLRTGPQFSFDVGAASEGGKDAIRLLYTRSSGKRLYLAASVCPSDLAGGCYRMANWGTPPPSDNETPIDAFNPNVTAWSGFIGLPPSWQATYVYRYGKSVTGVYVARQTLGYVNGGPFTIPVDLVRNTPVCSDGRGYWTDYDAMLVTGFHAPATTFLRFVTDSSKGCTERWTFTGKAQHVQAVKYDY